MLQINEIQMFKGDPTNIFGEQIKQPDNIISMEVTEVLNGNLTLTMVCAASSYNLENITIGNIIKCYKDILKEEQFSFEIYNVKYTIDHKITVKAEHISSRLRYIYVKPIGSECYNFSCLMAALNGKDQLPTGVKKYYLINHTGLSPIKIEIPENSTTKLNGDVSTDIKSITDIMRGTRGSILDIFGHGYWEYKEDTIISFNLGTNTEEDNKKKKVEPIKYAINMSDFKREIDMDNAKSNQVLFWKKEVDGVVEHVWACNRKSSDTYFLQASQLLDLSSKFEAKPTEAQLIAAASAMSTSPEVTTSCTVSEYEGLVKCGNNIPILYPEFGVKEEMCITETVYSVLSGRYRSIKLGTIKKTLSRTIAEIAGKTNVGVY